MRFRSPRPFGLRVLLLLAISLVAVRAGAAVTTLDWYRMGETENGTPGAFANSTPDSVGGNTLTLVGAPFYSADVGATAFAGTGSQRSLDFFPGNTGVFGQATLLTTSNFCVGLEVWAKAYNTGGTEFVVYNGTPSANGFGIVRAGNQWRAQFGGVGLFGSAPVVVDRWTHLAILQFSGVSTFYVDGIAVGQAQSVSTAATGAFSVAGALPFASTGMFDGLVDEVRLFTFAPGQFQPRDLLLFGPEIALERPALAELASGSTSDFGAVAMGSSATRTITVRNQGPGLLNLTGLPRVAISGPNAAEFTVSAPPSASLGTTTRANVANAGFETPALTTGVVSINPAGAGWTFGTQAGIAHNGSTEYAGNAPEGTQAAVILTVGPSAAQSFMSQTVLFPTSGAYAIRFRAARRAQNQANSLEVRMDNVVVGTVPSTWLDEGAGDNEWRQVAIAYTPASPGAHVLTIAGTRTGGNFGTAVDDVVVQQQNATIANAGFETPPLAPGAFAEAPSGTSWSFSLRAGFTQPGLPSFPTYQYRMEGRQALYLDRASSVSQTFSFPNVGSHVLRFKTAKIGGGRDPNRIEVRLGGKLLIAVPESSLTDKWQQQAVPFEIATAGAYTLLFEGNLDGGAMIDDVEVQYRPSTTFDVQFRPTAGLARNATLQVASNDGDENPYVLALTGNGTGPDIVVEQPAGTNIVSGGSRTFGTVQPGTNPTLTFTVSNNGTTPTVDNLVASIAGTDASSFLVSRKPASSASAGSPATFVVMFDPLSPGTKSAELRIASNDGDENPFVVNLAGAVAATVDMLVDQDFGATIPDGGSRTFFVTGVGDSSCLNLNVVNTGNSPLQLTGTPRVLIDGANPSDFFIAAVPAATVAAAIGVGNAGFEAPTLNDGTSTLDPPATGLRWQYGTDAGVATNGSGFFTNNAPQGRQAALVRNNNNASVISQGIAFPGAGDYELRFDAVRAQSGATNDLYVKIDGQPLTTLLSSGTSTTWQTFARRYASPGAGTRTLSFTGLTANSAMPIDNVRMAGASRLQVCFSPTAGGTRTAALHIASNDPDTPTYDISLSGVGDAPEIAVEQPESNNLVDGDTRSFGNVETGTSTSLVFTVRNQSSIALLSGIAATIDGADASSFTLTSQPAASLLPGDTTTLTVRFEPLTSAGKTAALHVTSNDADENPFDVVLQGNGTATSIEIGLDQPAGSDVRVGDTRSFPVTPIGTPVTLDFSLYNTGNTTLVLGGTPRVQVTGANAGEFVVVAQPPGALGGSPTVRNRGFEEPALDGGAFAYAPSLAGWTFGAKAGVAHGSSAFLTTSFDGMQAAFIQVTGASATDSFLSQPVAFASGNYVVRFIAGRRGQGYEATDLDVRINGVSIGTVPASNLGDDWFRTFSFPYSSPSAATRTLSFHGTRTGGDYASWIDAVQVATAAPVQVRFTPTATGLRTATLSIANNDSNENPYTVALTGSSTGPDIAVEQPAGLALADGEPRNLGTVVLGNNTTTTFTIRNTGTAPLTGLTTTVDGPDFTFFQIDAAPVAPLAPGASTTLGIYFSPFEARTYNATLHIASNDVDENPFDIPLVANGSQANIAVLQNGSQIGDGSLSSFGFAIPLGQSRTITYAIGNNGVGQDLTGIAVSIAGPDAGMFGIDAPPATAAAPGVYNPFVVTFTPTATGTRSATMTITSSDPDENPYTLFLEGQVVAPEIVIEQPSGSNLPDGGARNFGNVAVGTNASLTFAIRNLGTGPLTGIAATLGGPDAGRFAITQAPPVNLASSLSNIFIVRFTPGAAGAASATLQIASNDLDENPFDIALSGNGTTAELDVEQPTGTALPTGDARDFGVVRVGANATLTFAARNSGVVQDLTGLVATIAGPGAAAYAVTTAPAASVAAGDSTPFAIRFAPATGGTFDATLSLASSDEDENPYVIALSGSAIDPEIAVEQPAGTNLVDGASRDFGDVNLGGNATLAFELRNTGTTPLTGVLATLGGPGAASYAIATVPDAEIAPGTSTTLVVRFAPNATGASAATLQVSSNDGDEDPFDVALTGRGTVAEIDLEQPAGTPLASGGARSFGSIGAGSTATLAFVVRNTGFAQSLIGLDATVAGPDASAFSITNAPGGSLAAGASAPFGVVFAPTAAGTFDATLVIASSDADEDPYEIALTGTSTAVLADLQVGKSNGEGTLLPTRDTVYTVQVLNGGPATVPAVRVLDDLPSAFTNVQWTCLSAPANLCPSASGSGDIDQTTAAALGNGALLEYRIVARPSGTPGTLLTNTASAQIVGSGVTDGDGSNNTASDTDPIVGDAIFFSGFENGPGLLRPVLHR